MLKVKPVELTIFERHITPKNKIVLMSAMPGMLSARYALDLHLQYPLEYIKLPKYVGTKLFFLSAHNICVHWIKLDINMTRQDQKSGFSDRGKERYQSFITAMLQAGYEIEWQAQPWGYQTRAAFERALTPSVNHIQKPRSYID